VDATVETAWQTVEASFRALLAALPETASPAVIG
jgi:hypothetical protein